MKTIYHIRRNLLTGFLLLLIAVSGFAAELLYTVAGNSMLPVIRPGDKVLVQTDHFLPIKRRDIVAISLKGRKHPMVKRVVAVEGDKLEIKNSCLWINDQALDPSVSINPDQWKTTLAQLERYDWTLPQKTVFILGDNPENSRDSRRLGIISISQVSGKVVKIIREM